MDYTPLSSGSTTELITDMMDHDNRSHHHGNYSNYALGDDIISHPAVQAVFYLIYGTIFILGIFGNVLVCYVVGRNKAMQTVTNFFITNLALADILLCALAVPFTPLYTFLGEWIFGRVLCHLVAYAQGTSVYISTLTLTSIAIDRFFVIIYPFKPRMRLTTCLIIIAGIWAFALLATLPYGIFLHYYITEGEEKYTCGEAWPSEVIRQVFSACTMVLQFFLPFLVILFCYIKVSIKLSDRVKAKPGTKSSKKEALERERKRRTNRMLIAMVFIFGVSWLPLNVFNLAADLSEDAAEWKYSNLTFFCAHAIAMSSTCYNPFLYGNTFTIFLFIANKMPLAFPTKVTKTERHLCKIYYPSRKTVKSSITSSKSGKSIRPFLQNTKLIFQRYDCFLPFSHFLMMSLI